MLIGLSKSDVLSTFPKPTSPLVTVTLELKSCPLTVVVLSTLPPNDVVTVEAKLASSFNAAASSFNVSNVPGAESTKLATAVST